MGQAIKPKEIIVYADENGHEPFNEWLHDLRDIKGKHRISARIERLAAGLYGDCEPVGEGVSELRMFFGPGYRVYFGEDEENIVVLLCGGDKSTQDKDIKNAKLYWKDFKDDQN